MRGRLSTYIATQSTNRRSYLRQEVLTSLFGWVPSLPGLALRGVTYCTMLRADGTPAIEAGVRIRFAENVHLGSGVFLDHGVYLHACPAGISIDDETYIMHESILHVFNFRDLPHAGITIGKRCFVGERTVIRGQGGVRIGDDVLIAPNVQILAINHVIASSRTPIIQQGINCRGIVIEDGAWLGAGSIITDGVRVGRNAVVGAGAVVTRDVPAGTVVVGMPAKAVKTLPDVAPPEDDAPPIIQEIATNGRRSHVAAG